MLRTSTVLFCLGTLGALALAGAQPKPQETPQPTPHHAMLLANVGTWEGTLTMSMAGMDAAPIPATETIEGVGPFWTQSRFECDFMGPFVGTGCSGYDTKKEKFVGTWIDSMSSNLTVMEGDYNAETKTLTMNYEAPDMMGGAIVPHRIETVFGDDTYTSHFYMGAGPDVPETMVIEMHRKGTKPVEAGAGR
jgi:hypothetical protein